MAARKQHSFLTFFLILILCINLLNVQVVRADGETPTEPPAPTQVVTEPPVELTEVPTEVPTEAPTELPTEVPGEATATAPESTPVPTETEAAATPIAEILTQIPENTEVVVIDAEGTPVPLVSEAAAEITEMYDPMWCPAGVLPGGPGCTTNFSSIAALITNMINSTASYTQNGVIYFVETTGGGTTGSSFSLTSNANSLGAGDFNTLNDFNLTLQGGWNGQNGNSATFTGTTNFGSNSITIGSSGNPWAGNVTINDMSFNNPSNTAVTVYTTSGDITLSDVDVSQQTGDTYAAVLSSTSGDITVENGSSFDGDNTGPDESQGLSATTGTGSIGISDTTFSDALQGGTGNTANGATLSASTVTLTNVTSTNNDGNGIAINNASLVTLNNVTATNNGTESGTGGIIGNTGSGVFVNGTAGSSVIINGGTFNNNQEYGVEVGDPVNTTIYVQSAPTCTGNDSNTAGLGCYNDGAVVDNTVPVITPTVNGTAGANGWYTSNVSVTWAVSDPESGIKSQTGCTASNLTSETTGVTLTCSATNNAQLTNSVSVTIKIDKTAPTAALAITGGTQGANGWYTSDVTVQTTGTDAVSGVTCTAEQVLSTDTTGTVVNGSCTNGAGLVTNANPLTVKLDKTAPGVSLTVTSGTAGSNGWYTSNVTIHTSGTETVSGPLTCTADQFQTAETGGTNFNGSCTNAAGLTGTAAPLNIKLDKTNPTITFIGRTPANGAGWNNTNVTVNWTCSDSGSGPANDTVSQTLSTEGTGQSATGTCTDLAGNTASDTQGGINIDKTAPSLSLPSDITAEASSSAGAIVTYSASVTDNLDANVTLSCDPASGSLFPLGATKVGCTSTDQAGNSAGGSFPVFVGDTNGPVITAHADVTVEATSASGAVVSYTIPTATDLVDGPVPVICDPASGETFQLGNTTVTCNAGDLLGNQTTTTFVVHVVDTTAPTVADHNDVTVEAVNASGATATYTLPTATDLVDGEAVVSCTPASGSQFPLGNTTVTCSATDSHNNTGTNTFVVHVVDTTPPVIAGASDITVEATGPGGAQVSYTTPSATDTVDGTVAVNCSPASNSTFPVGDTPVTCNAMDTHNNLAKPVIFTIHVVDTTAPTLNLPGNITLNATGPNGAVATFSVTASDTVDQSVLVECDHQSGATFPIGTTQVTCTATDNSENQSQGSFFINVMDPQGPILSLPADMVVEATGPNGAKVNFTVTATDVIDGNVPVTCTPASGSNFPFGSTAVQCQASDSGEHTNTGSFFILVQDTTAPAITPHDNFSTQTDSPTGVIVNYTSPATSDAVDGPGTASCTPTSGTLFPIGDTVVTCTATDSHGNTSTSSFTVQVTLTQPGSTETGTNTSSSSIIPLTGAELIDLDCDSVLWAFSIKLSYFNLCDYQTALHSVGAGDLPGDLPEGFSFVMGLDMKILSAGQPIEELPESAGVEMDFPLYHQSPDQFAVLYWSEADGKWIEISEQIDSEQILKTLGLSEGDELYQVLTEKLSDLFYQILTAQKTGVFVLVKK